MVAGVREGRAADLVQLVVDLLQAVFVGRRLVDLTEPGEGVVFAVVVVVPNLNDTVGTTCMDVS